MTHPLRWLVVFVVVGAAATAGDAWFHHATGVVLYAGGVQPWWVFVLMGSSGVALAWQGTLLSRGLPTAADPAGRGALPLDIAIATLAYAATGFAPLSAGAMAALLTVVAALRFATRPSPMAAANTLVVGIQGPLVEVLLSLLGAFAYRPDLHHLGPVPVWLPPLYLVLAQCGESVSRALVAADAPATAAGARG